MEDKDKTLQRLLSNNYKKSVTKLEDEIKVVGYDFNKGIDYEQMFKSYLSTGFQATAVGQAIECINQMIKWRLSDEPIAEDEEEKYKDPEVRQNTRCAILLGITSNMSSCGMREYIRYLAQHKMVSAIVQTCGGIEEDFMKLMSHFYIGDFALDGKTLRDQGLNRTGNLIVPNHNYHVFEAWFKPLLRQLHQEQVDSGFKTIFGPSDIIYRMGKKLDDDNFPNKEESIYYWCYKNNIPVFSPALTDGAIGDCMYFMSYEEGREGFICDIARDVRKINDIPLSAKKRGQIILGGGVIKHHVNNANLMGDGANYSVYVNTALEFDGSDSGARPDEAVSWGKIAPGAVSVKVYSEASIVWPIIMGESFVRNHRYATRL